MNAVRKILLSRAFSKAVDILCIASTSIVTLVTPVSALDIGFGEVGEGELIPINNFDLSSFVTNLQPFITAALPILCVVGGIKLGVRFLRSAIH